MNQPYVSYNTHQFKSDGKCIQTYKKVVKEMAVLIKKSWDNEVHVFRQRRGCWGEWFEIWGLDANGKPKINKQGWQ